MTRHSLVWTAVGFALLSCAPAPETPLPPAGSAWAIADEPAEFVVSATGRGVVSCRIDWGDGDTSIWTQWVTSGVQVATSHAWDTAGVYSISTQARSSDGVLSNWSAPTSLRVLPRPGYPSRAIGRAQLRGKSRTTFLSPDGSRLFVRNNRGELAVVRTADIAVETYSAIPGSAFAVSWDGQYMYSLLNAVVVKYRTSDWVAVDSLALGDTLRPWSIAASPLRDELYLLASLPGSDTSEILAVDGELDVLPGSMGLFLEAYDPTCSPDGQSLYVCDLTSLYRFDLSTRTRTGIVRIGLYPGIAAVSADGRQIYVNDDISYNLTAIDAASFSATEWLPDDVSSSGFAVSPNGRFVFNRWRSGGFDSVSVHETGSWRLVAKFDPGQAAGAWSYIIPSADGMRLYLVSTRDSVVQVLGF